MINSLKNVYLNISQEFKSFKIYNQNLYLHLIVIMLFMDLIYCFCQQLSLVEKWDILLKTLDPCIDAKDIESQFQVLEYLRCFKQQISEDLSLLDSKQEIQQYYEFIKHIVEKTQDYYDQITRDYTTHQLYVQNLHIKHWDYWYQIKILRI